MITFEDIKNNSDIRAYIDGADESLKALGFTEHSIAHVTKVSETAKYIMESLGYDNHTINLVCIAAYLHDIGNLVNRIEHSQSGAVMAFRILDNLGMDSKDIATIVSAIGNHDEGTGIAVNSVAAALIIADKTDVRKTRVRNLDIPSFDIHDRVNYSVENAVVTVKNDIKEIWLELTIDTSVSSVMDYFEIFLERMIMCRKAAERLDLKFTLIVNGLQLL